MNLFQTSMEGAQFVAAGFVAGAMNAVAGGGTFATLPALVAAGMPAAIANASSTVALFPGSVSSAWAYRRELRGPGEVGLGALMAATTVGGLLGALLLLSTPERMFDLVVPWLLLLATGMLALGERLREALRRQGVRLGPGVALGVQGALGVYGGYFGGGVGLMMLALWAFLGTEQPKTLAPVRTLMVGAANAAAVLCFIVAGAVRWPETCAVLVGAVAGGYVGARVARRLPAPWVRFIVLLIASSMTVVFFLRAYAVFSPGRGTSP